MDELLALHAFTVELGASLSVTRVVEKAVAHTAAILDPDAVFLYLREDGALHLRGHRERSGGGHVPIIAMTADVEDSFRERCLASGMDAYLSKPFDQKQLASVLARFIPRRSAHSRRNRIP